MCVLVLSFVALATILVVAGAVLAFSADQIADVTRLGRLLVGSILLAGATSLPELTVDISAVREGQIDLAVGDLLGSSLMNLLILAVLDLSHRSRGAMLSRVSAAHALGGMLSIGLTAVVGLALATTKLTSNWSFLGGHLWLWLVAIAYTFGVRLVFMDQRVAARDLKDSGVSSSASTYTQPLWKLLLIFAGAAVVIFLVGPRLASVAGQIADLSGLGGTFIGTTLVALSTSLPELVASLAALRIGAVDLCIGNIFGSNAFNMLLFLPLDFAHQGSLLGSTGTGHLISAFAVIACTSIVIAGQLYQSESHLRFVEPDAWLVIVAILGSLFLVYSI